MVPFCRYCVKTPKKVLLAKSWRAAPPPPPAPHPPPRNNPPGYGTCQPSLVPRPLYARGARFLPRRNKGLVSTVLRMCQFKTNEYTQTTLLGVELLRVTFYVWIFPLNLPQVGNLECNNMASTNVCRLDSRSSVNLFTAIGLICNFTSWKYIYIILRLFVCNFNGPLESQLSSK